MPPKRAAAPAPREGPEAFLVPLGLLVALVVPYLVWLADSPEQLRDSKLVVQAAGAAIALAGLAWEAWRQGSPFPTFGELPAAGRIAVAAIATAFALALASGVVNEARVDPLTAAAVLSPVALALAGASRRGAAAGRRVVTALLLAGVLTGLLAAAQRFVGLFRLIPIEATEPRFLAVALIGNPGDVAAALLFPALLLSVRMTAEDGWRPRLLAAAGLAACLVGLGATESIAPFGALGAGLLAHTLLDLRARWKPLVAALLLAAAAAAATGTLRRALVKLDQLRRGETATATTQRDIGILAALEMVRAHPLLGVGPGAFSNAFVPARLRAEERVGRRLLHTSGYAHFENAHSDPLTLAAENGVPAALLAGVSAAALAAGLFRFRKGGRASRPVAGVGADTLIALLAAFLVLSLASFPLRLAVVLGPFAFSFGLAIHTMARQSGQEPRPSRRLAALLGALTLLTLLTAGVRFAAVSLQADGELRLQATAVYTGAARSEMNDAARRQLKRSLALRPASPTAWLALGSSYRIDREWEPAFLAYVRSLGLEERAETDFNLGLVVLNGASPENAGAFFRRALWILPRLSESLSPPVDADAMTRSIAEEEKAVASGGHAPELPDGLTPKL
jgi:O-antigen ligase